MSLILIIILSVVGGILLAIAALGLFAARLEQEAAQFELMSGRSLRYPHEMTGRRGPAIL